MRRRFGRNLHYGRSAHIRHEYEPGANLRLRSSGALLAGPVDLFHRAAYRHVVGRGSLSSKRRSSGLRQAAPCEQQALYLLWKAGDLDYMARVKKGKSQ